MRGHIAKKGNRYYAVIYDGVDPSTGKPKRRWHAAGTTRRGAERVLADLVKRKHDGTYVAPERITVTDYLLERWLPGKRTRVAPSTAEIYERNVRLYIAPNLGRIQLQELQPEDLDSLYARLLREGGSAGSGLSVRSVRLVHATLQSALRDAVRKGTVHRNVADAADPPAIGHDRRLARVWTGEQIRDFLAAIDDHDLYPLFLLAVTTGCVAASSPDCVGAISTSTLRGSPSTGKSSPSMGHSSYRTSRPQVAAGLLISTKRPSPNCAVSAADNSNSASLRDCVTIMVTCSDSPTARHPTRNASVTRSLVSSRG